MLITYPLHPTSGDSGDGYIVGEENLFDSYESTLQFVLDALRHTVVHLFGSGILENSYTAPLLTMGTGLTVLVVPHVAINGYALELTNDYEVPIPPSSSFYIWQRDDNSDTLPQYVLTDLLVDPSTSAHDYILLGEAVTDATDVITITEMFNIVKPLTSYVPSVPNAYVPVEETFALAWDSVDRSGGTVYALTLSDTPIPSTPISVQREEQMAVPTTQYGISGDTITFTDGHKPIAGEIVTVRYFKAP